MSIATPTPLVCSDVDDVCGPQALLGDFVEKVASATRLRSAGLVPDNFLLPNLDDLLHPRRTTVG